MSGIGTLRVKMTRIKKVQLLASDKKMYTRFDFLKATLLEATPRSNWQKNYAKGKQHPLRLNFRYLKIIRFLHPRYHLKIIE